MNFINYIKINTLLILLFLLCNCNRVPYSNVEKLSDTLQMEKGKILVKKAKWIVPIVENCYSQGIVKKNITYNNAALAIITRNDEMYLALQSAENGRSLWEKKKVIYSDGIYPDEVYNDIYQKDENFIFPITGKTQLGFGNIDLNTGDYKWESPNYKGIFWYDYFPYISGVDSLFFFAAKPYSEISSGKYTSSVYCGNIETGICRFLFAPPIEKTIETDSIKVDLVCPVKHNDTTYVFTGYTCHNISYIGLFNMNNNTWVYSNKIIEGHDFDFVYKIAQNYVYFALYEGAFYCLNFLNGQIIWSNSFPYASRNILEINDMLILNLPDGIGAFNKFTGERIWSIGEVYPYEYMNELNGIIYFHNGALYAVDSKDGRVLWELLPENGGRFSECSVIPGVNGKKGTVIGRTEAYSLGYEAIK